MAKKKINHSVARAKILNYLEQTSIPAIEEFAPAVVSHWMQNPDDKVFKNIRCIFEDVLFGIESKKSQVKDGGIYYDNLFSIDVPFPPPKNPKFTFIDLFAGIGGFRIAMQDQGGQCVFSSEWDLAAQKTYDANYGEVPFGDITKDEVKRMIPKDFDILCGGFPCQAFSIAGYREGFNDKKNRGNLFFDIAQILKDHKPRAFLLENVKNLKAHDGGKTYEVIQKTLESLGYHIKSMVLNTMEYGNVPQNRERIYIVGFSDKKIVERFKFPEKTPLTRTIHSCLLNGVNPKYYYSTDKELGHQLDAEIKRKDTVYQWRRIYVRENKNNVCPTLTANMGMGGHNVPLIRDDKGVRKLTPRECANFQGYPESFILPSIADSSLYKQFGNSVSIPVLERIVQNMRRAIDE
jgi:DNA (cytosine-5)-methyltransferase 1